MSSWLREDIEARSALGSSDVKVVQLPRDAAPANALHDATGTTGLITTVRLSANEPVLPTKIAHAGSEGTSRSCHPGRPWRRTWRFRAMSVNIPDSNAAVELIEDRGSHRPPVHARVIDPIEADFVGRIVLQDIPVLAKTLTVYTLRVDAATAERIAALQASGGTCSCCSGAG
jgi:hypothetical protein